MITRPAGSALHLITQPAHAALARRVMEQWTAGGLADHSRCDSILHAIEQHDNGWMEVDAAPMRTAEGRIADFMTLLDNRMTVNTYRQELFALDAEQGKAWADLEMLVGHELFDANKAAGVAATAQEKR